MGHIRTLEFIDRQIAGYSLIRGLIACSANDSRDLCQDGDVLLVVRLVKELFFVGFDIHHHYIKMFGVKGHSSNPPVWPVLHLLAGPGVDKGETRLGLLYSRQ
jgi:hypothetical protein